MRAVRNKIDINLLSQSSESIMSQIMPYCGGSEQESRQAGFLEEGVFTSKAEGE